VARILVGDLNAAIEQYKKIVALPGSSRTVAAQALIHLGQCYEKLGEAQVKETQAPPSRSSPGCRPGLQMAIRSRMPGTAGRPQGEVRCESSGSTAASLKFSLITMG
jgi:hypothetical protein